MFLSEWRAFPSAPCLAGKNLMATRVSILLKSCASLTLFQACFLPGGAKDVSEPRIYTQDENSINDYCFYNETVKLSLYTYNVTIRI